MTDCWLRGLLSFFVLSGGCWLDMFFCVVLGVDIADWKQIIHYFFGTIDSFIIIETQTKPFLWILLFLERVGFAIHFGFIIFEIYYSFICLTFIPFHFSNKYYPIQSSQRFIANLTNQWFLLMDKDDIGEFFNFYSYFVTHIFKYISSAILLTFLFSMITLNFVYWALDYLFLELIRAAILAIWVILCQYIFYCIYNPRLFMPVAFYSHQVHQLGV